MAEQKDEAEVNQSTEQSQSFVEVICKCTGKTWRFAAGTEAKFALKFINSSSVDSILANQPATYVEAVKDGEVPVIFGPNSILVFQEGCLMTTQHQDQNIFLRFRTTHILQREIHKLLLALFTSERYCLYLF
ncbi:hypothetical protein AABB24_037616 [Solanum stoloniferum]|uniref:Uncharacterized protein n=1 Tax=Solanum stoloniferum TaxID=62892 RepID=A0ABD2R5E3_9SOLN